MVHVSNGNRGAIAKPSVSMLNRWLDRERDQSDISFEPSPLPPNQKVGDGRKLFEVSAYDFNARARAEGWGFWRGLAVGFLCGFLLTYVAVTGEHLIPLP
jgi:hypothetical protein